VERDGDIGGQEIMSGKYLGVTDAGFRLGLSASRVRQLEAAGILHAEKLPNGQRIFLAEDVDRLARERAQRKQMAMSKVS
jgi:DNA-binding transcriptional MerR regulator